jgi:hypothetical protein
MLLFDAERETPPPVRHLLPTSRRLWEWCDGWWVSRGGSGGGCCWDDPATGGPKSMGPLGNLRGGRAGGVAVEKCGEGGSGGRSTREGAGDLAFARNDGVMDARRSHPGLLLTAGLEKDDSVEERGRSSDGFAVDGGDAVLMEALAESSDARSEAGMATGRRAARVAMKRGETPSCSSLVGRQCMLLLRWRGGARR